MDRGSRKGKVKWNISSETGLQRKSMVVVANYKMRDDEAWRCLDPAGIPTCAWYGMPLWINLETEPPIISSRIYLEQASEGWRFHDRLSTPMYEKMLIIRNGV